MNLISKFDEIIIDKNMIIFLHNQKEMVRFPIKVYKKLLDLRENKFTFIQFFSKQKFDFFLIYIPF